MKHRLAVIGFWFCAVTAAAAVGFWFVLSFLFARLSLSPAGSVALVGIACLSTYAAGRLRAWLTGPSGAAAVMRRCFLILFCLYLLLLLHFTLADAWFSRQNVQVWSGTGWEGLRYRLEHMTNLVPFQTIRRYLGGNVNRSIAFTNLAGNAAAFAPFALFLPLQLERARKFRFFALYLFLSILAVECTQLLLGAGFFDVDDFILNAGGAFLTFALLHWRPVRRLVNRLTVTPW